MMFFNWALLTIFAVVSTGSAGTAEDYPPGKYYKLNMSGNYRNIVCSNMTTVTTDGCNGRFGHRLVSQTYPWFVGEPENIVCRIFTPDKPDGYDYYQYPSGLPESIPPGGIVRCNLDGYINESTKGILWLGPVRLNFFNTDIDGHLAVMQYGGPAPRN